MIIQKLRTFHLTIIGIIESLLVRIIPFADFSKIEGELIFADVLWKLPSIEILIDIFFMKQTVGKQNMLPCLFH